MRNQQRIHMQEVMRFLSSFSFLKCLSIERLTRFFNLTKIFKSYSQTFITHYACRNADLKLTLDTGTTNGFITQIINSLIESRRGGGGGGYMTWLTTSFYF